MDPPPCPGGAAVSGSKMLGAPRGEGRLSPSSKTAAAAPQGARAALPPSSRGIPFHSAAAFRSVSRGPTVPVVAETPHPRIARRLPLLSRRQVLKSTAAAAPVPCSKQPRVTLSDRSSQSCGLVSALSRLGCGRLRKVGGQEETRGRIPTGRTGRTPVGRAAKPQRPRSPPTGEDPFSLR